MTNVQYSPSASVIVDWASAKQEWLFTRGPAPTLLAGGQDSAKTTGGILKLLALHQTYPGSRSVVVRRAYNHLTKTTMETFFKWCKPEFYRPYGSFNANSGILDYNNGSRTYFLHLDHPDSLDVLKGLEINFAFISQAEEIEEEAWELLDVRCGRWVCPVPDAILNAYPGGRDAWPWKSEDGSQIVPPRYIFAESYVTDEGHWLYKRFAEESPERSKWAARGYECKIVNSTENKFANKEVTAALLSKSPAFIRRYVIPQWGNVEGQLLNLCDESILEPTPELILHLQRSGSVHRVLDHGDTTFTCMLWYSIDQDGNIFFFREYYKIGYDPETAEQTLLSQHRKNIFDLSQPDYRANYPGWSYRSDLADPQIFSMVPRIISGRAVESRFSVADEYCDPRYGRENAIYFNPGDKNEQEAILRIREFLFVDPTRIHPITRKKGSPTMFFVKRTEAYPHGCVHAISETRAQRRVLLYTDGETKHWGDDRDQKVVDHAFDCVRYTANSRPGLGSVPNNVVAFRATKHTEGPLKGRVTIPASKFHEMSKRAKRFAR